MSRFDSYPRERWDRDRFERAKKGSEQEYYRHEERESPRGRMEVMVDERRGPNGRFEERERFFEEERYAPPARRAPAFLEDPIPAEVSRQALTPYRKPRPQFIRRQSSLDTFDRRAVAPRYGDEYRLPAEVPIPLPIRRPHSPPRGRYYEEFEERYRDSDDDYRDIRVREERRGHHREQSRMRSRSVRRRRTSSISSQSSFEEVNKSSIVGRKGRTKLPKRLAHKSAIIELGYPFEEDDKFITVQRALDKDHIDVIVEKSKKYREESKVVYKYEGTVDKVPPPKEEKKEEKVEKKETKITTEGGEVKKEEVKVEKKTEAAPPPPPAPAAAAAAPPPPPPAPPAAETDLVKKTTTTTTTTIDPPDHHHFHQDLAVIDHRHRYTDSDIRREIRQLEAERQALKLERAADYRLAEAERLRDGDWEIIQHERHMRTAEPKNIYRVERDRRGRMALVRSAH